MAVVIAVVVAGLYFRTTFARWAPWLFGVISLAVVVAAIAGVELADEVMTSFADRRPKDVEEFIGWVGMAALIGLIRKLLEDDRDDESD